MVLEAEKLESREERERKKRHELKQAEEARRWRAELESTGIGDETAPGAFIQRRVRLPGIVFLHR